MDSSGCPATAIDSSNIGFQLLKKHGWKEGTGLGVSEQGRLEPVEAHANHKKRGLGADVSQPKKGNPSKLPQSNNEYAPSKKSKSVSNKKQRKLEQLEKRLEEREFERAFFREFWPDNV